MKKKIYALLILILPLFACSPENEPDAWGSFEATEIIISSEANGRILKMLVNEGDIVNEGDLIAIIDSTLLSLKFDELNASKKSIISRINTIDAQNRVLKQQITNLKIDIYRVKKMLDDGAATQKQYDDLTGQSRVMERQFEANESQKASVRSEFEVLESRKSQLAEQISRCKIYCPSSGTVIQKFSEAGEITAMGKPVIKIANLTIMDLKVYVSGAHLAEVKIGDVLQVRIDNGEKGYTLLSGTVANIADKAEFTPKIIQTKEERVSLVYAVTLKVENDGSLKSGMPGEVIFQAAE